MEFHCLGEACPDSQPEHLTLTIARRTLAACRASESFKVVELRRWRQPSGGHADVIVVDCINDQVPSRNPIGIKIRERLALVFSPNPRQLPEVRALRKNFPSVLHLNLVLEGEPNSLCLYFETWSAIERTWTPQKHLQRILWWLAETAKGTLHHPDQPVEGIYFDPIVELILPPDFDMKVHAQALALTLVPIYKSDTRLAIRGLFGPRAPDLLEYVPLVLTLELVQAGVESHPANLGALHDQFERRGAPLLEPLRDSIRQKTPPTGIAVTEGQTCLLIVHLAIKRAPETPPERVETRGFWIQKDLASLGRFTRALHLNEGRYYATPLIGGRPQRETAEWRSLETSIIGVKRSLTKAFARQAAGIDEGTAEFKGVIAGVGSLGGTLADLWAKEAWGEWTFIDDDFVQPHNIVRHMARDLYVGQPKVMAAKNMIEQNYEVGYNSVRAIQDSVINWSNPDVRGLVTQAGMIVDVTTTVEVPRELSQLDEVPRSVSVFITPSGQGSALLFEDADRAVRLEALEAQYYRAVINSTWGERHLEDPSSSVQVGRGCRDISVVMAPETVMVHAATLARQVRVLRDCPEARIRVWSLDQETNALAAHEIPVQQTERVRSGNWTVLWDVGIQNKLSKIRHSCLPNETGGVILGYIDHKLKSIYVVDILPAPSDSEADETGFTRGVGDLTEAVQRVARRTRYIVGYIGEWHSHPPFASARPSRDDRVLVQSLADILAVDGQPALMIIVGASEYCITVRDSSQ